MKFAGKVKKVFTGEEVSFKQFQENIFAGYNKGKMQGGYNHSKQNPNSGNNPVLNFARNLLGNKNNAAPTAKFYQKQKQKQDMINQLLNQETEHEGEMVEKISASGYARAKKYREDQAREKNRRENPEQAAYFREVDKIKAAKAKRKDKAAKNLASNMKKEEVEQIDEYSPNVSYQAKGGKKSGKLGKSSVYSLKDKGESKKEFRKSHTKDIKDGLLKKEEVELVDEKISASGYARAKKWREQQAAKKDRDDNAKWEEKARTHKWDGKTWNKRDKPTHEKGQGPHAKKAAAANAQESVEFNAVEDAALTLGELKGYQYGGKVQQTRDGIGHNGYAMGGKVKKKSTPKSEVAEVPKNGTETNEGSAYGIFKGDGVRKLPGDKKKEDKKVKKEAYTLPNNYMNSSGPVVKSQQMKDTKKAVKKTTVHAYEEVEVVDEAKVDKGRSDYGKASIRNYRRKVPGHGEPAMFDPENKRGKLIDKRREEHKARRGVKGAKVPAYKREEVEVVDEATRLKKEKGYEKGGSKDKALNFVKSKIRKEYGKPEGQRKKEKGVKSTAGTGKYLERAKERAAYKARAKKAGFKSTQDYTDTVARYGSEDNYKKGKGLGT